MWVRSELAIALHLWVILMGDTHTHTDSTFSKHLYMNNIVLSYLFRQLSEGEKWS